MAKTTIVTLTDDLDGSKADRTVNFAFDGTSYEIDLSKKNATALGKALAPYIEASRKVRGTAPRGRRPVSSRNDLSSVRAWAKDNGYDISSRGRIPAEILDAYATSR